MFKFSSHNEKEQFSDQRQRDALNETATQIAIELINGDLGSSLYLKSMKRIFKKTPGMIEDVDPQYRERLKQVLDKEDY